MPTEPDPTSIPLPTTPTKPYQLFRCAICPYRTRDILLISTAHKTHSEHCHGFPIAGLIQGGGGWEDIDNETELRLVEAAKRKDPHAARRVASGERRVREVESGGVVYYEDASRKETKSSDDDDDTGRSNEGGGNGGMKNMTVVGGGEYILTDSTTTTTTVHASSANPRCGENDSPYSKLTNPSKNTGSMRSRKASLLLPPVKDICEAEIYFNSNADVTHTEAIFDYKQELNKAPTLSPAKKRKASWWRR